MATVFPILSKVPSKLLNPAAVVVDASTDYDTIAAVSGLQNNNNNTNLPLTTPPDTGILPFILSFLAMVASVLGDELIDIAAIYFLNKGLLPSLMAVRRLTVMVGTSATRLCRSFLPLGRVHDGDATEETRQFASPEATAAEEDDDDERFDAEVSLPSSEENPDSTPISPTNEELLAELRAEASEKDVRIADLSKAAETKSGIIEDLDQRNSRLMGNLRTALDPIGLYTPTTDIVVMANDVRSDYNRASKKIERQKQELKEARDRQENGQLAQKGEQISVLTNENARLNGRIVALEEGQRHCVRDVERIEQLAKERVKKLKDRTEAAESTARQAISQRQYGLVRDQLSDVVEELRQLKHEKENAVHAEERLTNELQAERVKTQELQITANNEAEVRQQSDDLLTAATGELQQANDKIDNFEREALAKDQQVRDAGEKARAAENQVTENATTVSELKQSLQESRDQAKEWRESNEQLARQLQRKEEALERKNSETKSRAAEHTSNQGLVAEIENLRSQLDAANKEAQESFESGFLNAMSQSQPNEQGVDAADQHLANGDQQDGSDSVEGQLRGQIESLIAANKDLQLELDSHPVQADSASESRADQLESEKQELLAQLTAIEQRPVQGPAQATDLEKQELRQEGYQRAVQDCERDARTQIDQAVQKEMAQKEQALRAPLEKKWNDRETEWKANLNAAVEKEAAEREQGLREQLRISVQRAITAETLVNNPNSELKKAQEYATGLYKSASEQWQRAEGEKKRADGAAKRAQDAEAEIGRYKQGKASQDQRLKEMQDQIRALKRTIPQQPELQAAEMEALENDRIRARALTDELAHRHYDSPSRHVLFQLINANDKLAALRFQLKRPDTRPSQILLLTMLLDAEVDKHCCGKLEPLMRQVLLAQSAAVNAKLMTLKHIINGSVEPSKKELLAELYKPRGDEEAEWDLKEPESEPESDEDEEAPIGGKPPSAWPQRPLPTGPRHRPSQQAEPQAAPVSTDPNINNPLKRKGTVDAVKPEGSGKRRDASDEELRPVTGPLPQTPQQGSSSPEADDDQNETKLKSQDDLPSSDRIGEAPAPQQQSNDQNHVSPQLPGSSSFPIQHFPLSNPAVSSGAPSHVDQALPPKPTRIPGPKPKAYLTPSERQERLAIRQYKDNKASSAQEAAATSSSTGPFGFSFSAPKDIASGILPHVRKYTRLSGTTNTILSRRQHNASTAKS